MVLHQPRTALRLEERATPAPGAGQVLLRVRACGVCRTDLHIVDGDLPAVEIPIIPGHEIVGVIDRLGDGVTHLAVGDRVGIPWLAHTCGICSYCTTARENLCDSARFTGYDIDGGYAELTVADERYCFPLPDSYDDLRAAPLLCAGLIGYRTLRLAGDAQRIGLYGFGAAAHLLAQVAVHQGRRVFAFTKPADAEGQRFARELGATWAGGSDERPPEPLDAALLFAPVGTLIPAALRAVGKGGTVVSGGIHMSDIPSFPYGLLWGERTVQSVANLTRRDGEEFLQIAARVPLRVETQRHGLHDANAALEALRAGKVRGAAVLVP